jgi:tetratricopeptide (TPR) repeat protein
MRELVLRRLASGAMREACAALTSSGRLEMAQRLCEATRERPELGAWAMIGLAKIATKRGDHRAAAAAWHRCLDRFPQQVQPVWLVELSRSERRLGDTVAAEQTLRRCVQRFPKFALAFATLAELLGTLARPEEAVVVWQGVLADFPDQAKPRWFVALAGTLRNLDRAEEAERVFGELVRSFPDDIAALAWRGEEAARHEDWSNALSLWSACLERDAAGARPGWLSGRAMALFRLWRTDEALAAWEDVVTRFAEFGPGYLQLVGALEEMGQWSRAERVWTELVRRFPHRVKPEWLVRQARCGLKLRVAGALAPLIAGIEARFPGSTAGRRLAIEFSTQARLGYGEHTSLIEDAARQFPDDRELLSRHAELLLALGRLPEATAVVEKLEAGGFDHFALISRWRIIRDREGDAAIRGPASDAVKNVKWGLGPALAIGDFLIDTFTRWGAGLALALFEDVADRFPGRIAALCAKARTLIALGHDDQALRLIDAAPSGYQGQQVLELRAWAAVRRDQLESAKKLWRTILSTTYFPGVHGPDPELELITPERSWPEPVGIAAFIPIRDELPNLPEFLRHHREIGVRRFFFIDHMSADGSGDYLSTQSDVILYRTHEDYRRSGAGTRWVNALIERHGAGGWCLRVDADESFVYPGYETTPLERLVDYLEREDAEGVAAFMLDVFPERLFDAAGNPSPRGDYRFFDGDYVWAGRVRAPYLQPSGGVRSRLFRVQEYLHKIPLIKSSRAIHLSVHDATALRLATVTAALLHYNLMALTRNRPAPWVGGRDLSVIRGTNFYTLGRRQRYASRFPDLAGIDLRLSGVSEPLADSLAMTDRGLLRAPPEFRHWLAGRPETG